jgi:hypothetical protein
MRQGRIRGIDLPSIPELQIIAQYANDTLLTIRGEESSVLTTVATL